MDPIILFENVLRRRETLIKGFQLADDSIFYGKSDDISWSPEALFRHLLTGMSWLGRSIGHYLKYIH